MQRTIAFFAAGAAALALAACATPASDDTMSASTGASASASATGSKSQPPAATQSDIIETARSAGNFTALLAAADAAGLTATLKGPGPYTVFAPTDDAFNALSPTLMKQLQDPANVGQLRAVLSYHVAPGRVSAAQLAGRTSEQATVLGPTFALTVNGAGPMVTVEGANVVKADVNASNGVIHVIDKVLIPAR